MILNDSDVMAQVDPWGMAGASHGLTKHTSSEAMERATCITKSFLVALALVKRHLIVARAALAIRVEVTSQIERWGEVEDCEFQPSCRGFKYDIHSLGRFWTHLGHSHCL